jgi:hypothetical protein
MTLHDGLIHGHGDSFLRGVVPGVRRDGAVGRCDDVVMLFVWIPVPVVYFLSLFVISEISNFKKDVEIVY